MHKGYDARIRKGGHVMIVHEIMGIGYFFINSRIIISFIFLFFPRTLVIIYFYRDEIKSFLSLLINRYKPDSAGWQSSLHDADMLRIQIITSEGYSFVQLVLSFEMFTRDRRQ